MDESKIVSGKDRLLVEKFNATYEAIVSERQTVIFKPNKPLIVISASLLLVVFAFWGTYKLLVVSGIVLYTTGLGYGIALRRKCVTVQNDRFVELCDEFDEPILMGPLLVISTLGSGEIHDVAIQKVVTLLDRAQLCNPMLFTDVAMKTYLRVMV